MTQPDRDPFRQPRNFKKALQTKWVVFAVVGGLGASLAHNSAENHSGGKEEPAGGKEKLANYKRLHLLERKYNARIFSRQGKLALEQLAGLAPDRIYGLNGGENRAQVVKREGQYIQSDISAISGELRVHGVPGKTDEYSVMKDVLGPDTKEAIKEAGITFTKVDPVNCDVIGEPYQNPADYSDHVGDEFNVRFSRTPTVLKVEVPLGTAQTDPHDGIFGGRYDARYGGFTGPGGTGYGYSAVGLPNIYKVTCTDMSTLGMPSNYLKEVYTAHAPESYWRQGW